MMRQQLIRSLRRSQRLSGVSNAANNARVFSTTGQRNAEVELTVDGKKVSIEGTGIRIFGNWDCHVLGYPRG
jgi:NADH dehydrogenase (ubiquinone) Fe-S protein 1